MSYYMAIDLKSFFASVECLDRNLDIFKTPLVVADISRGEGTITLAATPYLKAKGIKSRSRLYEIPKNIRNTLIYAKPRMSRYIEKSEEVMNVYLDMFAKEDILVYSIDEVFIDLSSYLDYYQKTPYDLAVYLQNEVLKRTGLHSACGVSYNMVMAKICMDVDSKHMKNGVSLWEKEDIPKRLWPIKPLTKMWGIGSKLQKRFNDYGMFTVGDIAKADPEFIKKHFGIMGVEIYEHANGIDNTELANRNDYLPKEKSISNGQTLYLNYYGDDVLLLILELTDKVAYRLRKSGYQAKLVHLSIKYNNKTGVGFSRQLTLDNPTDISRRIFEACKTIFYNYYDGSPVHYISVACGKLKKSSSRQLDIFGQVIEDEKERNLYLKIDTLNDKYGKNTVLRASSNLKKSTVKKRNKMIGGHDSGD